MTQRYEVALTLDPTLETMLEIVFPADSMMVASGEAMLQAACDDMIAELRWVLAARYNAAVSGAMRWSWSQEARIVAPNLRFG